MRSGRNELYTVFDMERNSRDIRNSLEFTESEGNKKAQIYQRSASTHHVYISTTSIIRTSWDLQAI